jgi:hypothetical protein
MHQLMTAWGLISIFFSIFLDEWRKCKPCRTEFTTPTKSCIQHFSDPSFQTIQMYKTRKREIT